MSQAEEYLINIRLTEDTNIMSINTYILIHNTNQPVKRKQMKNEYYQTFIIKHSNKNIDPILYIVALHFFTSDEELVRAQEGLSWRCSNLQLRPCQCLQ